MEKKFFKYPEIENAYQQGFIDKIKENGFGDIRYVIMEKIHGSNSQVSYNLSDETFTYGSRNHVLEDDEVHYHLRECVEPLKQNIIIMSNILAKGLMPLGQQVTDVTFFGEVCGGCYPHPNVPRNKEAMKVQKGVYYSPDNQWFAFDIGYELKDVDNMFFLSASKFFTYCAIGHIPMVPILHISGSLDKALAYKNDKLSCISKRNHLPPLDENRMEGVVIRPWDTDVWFGHTRLVIKNKNETFKEKTRVPKSQEIPEVSEKAKQAMEEVLQYVNYNRVHNVISKIGEVTVKQIGEVIMLTNKDVLADYEKEYDTLTYLDKSDEKLVRKFLNGEVAKCVRDVIVYGK